MSVKNQGWLTRNSLRSFPIMEGSLSIAENSGWKLDPALIVDVSFFSDTEGDVTLCIQSVTITAAICSIIIGDSVSGKSFGYASFIVGVDKPLSSKKIEPLVDGVGGFISIGTAILKENYSSLPLGFHSFGNKAPLETRCGISMGEFPVKSLSALAAPPISGAINLVFGDALVASVSEGSDDGDELIFINLSLLKPSNFLSPCETKTTPCDCDTVPIRTINGIAGDSEGIIYIEIEDEFGNIYLLNQNTLSFLITRTGSQLCFRQPVPDIYGRLPGPSDDYSSDAPPVNAYSNPLDTTFPSPVI